MFKFQVRFLIILFTFLGAKISCYSQKSNYETLLEKYEYFRNQNKLDSALVFAKKMNEWAYKNEGDTSLRYAVSYRYIGNCFIRDKTDSALFYFEEALLILSKQGREVHIETANLNFNLGLLYFNREELETAKSFYQKSLEIKEKRIGKENLDYANTLMQIANINFKNERFSEALSQYESVLNIRLNILGETDLLIADTYFMIGQLKASTNDYYSSIDDFLKTLSIRKTLIYEIDVYDIAIKYKLGELYRLIKNWEMSEKFLLEALNLYKLQFGENGHEFFDILESLGLLYFEISDFKNSEFYFTRSLEICENLYGKRSTYYSSTLLNLSQLYAVKGDYLIAKKLNDEYLKQVKAIHGEGSIEMANGLVSIAALFEEIKMIDSAIICNNKAVEIFEKAQGEELNLSIALGNLGNNFRILSKWKEADSCYTRSLNIKTTIGDTLENYAILLVNQGLLLINLNNIELGQKKLFKALEIQERLLGLDHFQTAITIQNIALTYTHQGNFSKSLHYLNLAKETLDRSVGKYHPLYATILVAIGNIYAESGDSKNAILNYSNALEIYQVKIGEKNQYVSDVIYNVGNVYFDLKNYQLAKEYYTKSLNILTDNSADVYGNLISHYIQLALVSSFLNDNTSSYECASKGIRSLNDELNTNFKWLSEKERNDFTKLNQKYFLKINSISSINIDSCQESAIQVYNTNLISKSLLLETSRELDQVISNSSDKEMKDQFNEMKQLRRLVNKMQSEGSDKNEILDSYVHQADSLDKILVNKLGEYANAKRKFEITWKDVQSNLSTTEAAIEFARYYDYKDTNYKYMALLVRSEYDYPKLVKLGSESLIKSSCSKMEFSELYDYVWKGIDSLLTGVNTIYYSPAGELNNVSFSALICQNEASILKDSSKSNWSYLIDKYELHQLTTTRYIADGTLKKNDSIPLSIKLIGGINYIDFPTVQDSVQTTESNEDLALQLNLQNELNEFKSNRGGKLDYLKGSEIEVKEVSKILQNSGWTTLTSTGRNASEYQFKQDLNVKSPGVIHIATHGFAFLEKEIKEDNEFLMQDNTSYKISEDPMVRCGLMLSGANLSWSGDSKKMIETTGDDGILTAAEIANMDLSNTKLVVLSACETGLGKIESLEGTFGLKRGFKLAGVDQLIVTLWKVPDNETMELMTIFYSDLAETNNPELSFNFAQKAMRNKYPYEPQKWAGFVFVQ